MAMTGGIGADGDTIADINTTPLIDVMLVLLVMLIITIPPVRHAVVLDTPQLSTVPMESPLLEPVRIGVDFDGAVSWNGEVVERAEWERRMGVEARRMPQPEIHIEPHRLSEYGVVAAVMASAQRSGLERMGVVGGT